MDKYHIALSFAGEDREYVEKVADVLRERGVDVFYDRFEETKLWGKDLYTYLVDIYQNKALYTVMFVSEAYKNNLWANHERKSAQARAFSESREYILPAMFDESVEIPGLLKTTGYISLKELKPADLAQKIISKLEDDGVELKVNSKFRYSDEAKADADFPMLKGDKVTSIIEDLRSYNWYTQNPAIERIFELNWNKVSADQLFVLGRNIYQCACGGERRAKGILDNLRRKMAKVPADVAEHLINGMFYEVYFNSDGEFRGRDMKSRCLESLFAIQSTSKYGDCIVFIRRALQPYRDGLAVLPNKTPENIEIMVRVRKKAPPLINGIIFQGKEMLIDFAEGDDFYNRMWKLSFKEFTLNNLKKQLSHEWCVPLEQLNVECDKSMPESTKFRLPEGKTIKHPYEA